MKKRRGAGNRGGRGRAGSGSAGTSHSGSKKPSYWKTNKGGKDPLKRGFVSQDVADIAINIGHLNSIATALVAKKKALEQSGKIIINLRELGYTKLLGAGKVSHKLNVSVKHASPKAAEKIKAAGGTLDVEQVVKEEPAEEPATEGSSE